MDKHARAASFSFPFVCFFFGSAPKNKNFFAFSARGIMAPHKILLLFTALVLALAAAPAGALVVPANTIYQDNPVRWSLADSPVILQGVVTVGRGAILTVDAGVIVNCTASAQIVVQNVLRVEGQPQLPVMLLAGEREKERKKERMGWEVCGFSVKVRCVCVSRSITPRSGLCGKVVRTTFLDTVQGKKKGGAMEALRR